MGHADHTDIPGLPNEGQVRSKGPLSAPRATVDRNWKVRECSEKLGSGTPRAIHSVGCVLHSLGLLTILTRGYLFGIVFLPRMGELGFSLLAQASEMPG